MSIRILKDGRTLLTPPHYGWFRMEVARQQNHACITCGGEANYMLPLADDHSFHLAHRGTRGMGSAIRDDVIGPKRGQVEGGKCGKCHRIEHNQQSAVQSQPQWSRA